MPLVLRTEKGSPLTYNEMDGNLQFLYSQSASGSGGGIPGGSNQQIQFNSASAFSGSDAFIFNYESSSFGHGLIVNPIGTYSHAQGYNSTAQGEYSHAEGRNTTAQGNYSHAQGLGTISSGSFSHTVGMYNDPISDPGAFVVGNGSGETGRSNLIIASSQSGFVVPLTAPPSPMTGSMYLDLTAPASIKFWDGNAWISSSLA